MSTSGSALDALSELQDELLSRAKAFEDFISRYVTAYASANHTCVSVHRRIA